MFQYQVDELRQTVKRILSSSRPPEKIGIKLEHAEFLGVEYTYSKPINEKRPSGLVRGVMYGSVVMVSLHGLFTALKDAVGIDAEDYEQSRIERAQKGEDAAASGNDRPA